MLDLAPSHGRYTLRPVVESDFDFLWGLKVATLKPYIEKLYGWDEPHARDILRNVMRGAHLVLLQGEPAGVLKVEVIGGFVYLAEIGLMPRHQNKGLGTCIIKDVLAMADRRGMPVELQVFAINPASKLYERLGFSVTHHEDVPQATCARDRHIRPSQEPTRGDRARPSSSKQSSCA